VENALINNPLGETTIGDPAHPEIDLDRDNVMYHYAEIADHMRLTDEHAGERMPLPSE